MEKTRIILIEIICIVISLQSLAVADPSVYVDISLMESCSVSSDIISSDIPIEYKQRWLIGMFLTSPGLVTAPRITFTSDHSFTDFSPSPTDILEPTTYAWNYPERTLMYGQDIHLNAFVDSDYRKPFYTFNRQVDNPILAENTGLLTITTKLTFSEDFPSEINNVGLRIGTLIWDQPIVEETILSQSDVPDWSNNSDGWWNAMPENIVIGHEYVFMAQIWCAKLPSYHGKSVYHKPKVSLLFSNRVNLQDQFGSETTLVHPGNKSTHFKVNENVLWQRSISSSRQDISLDRKTIFLNDSDMRVDQIFVHMGKEFSGEHLYHGTRFGVEVEGQNIIEGTMISPGGQIWPFEVEEDWIGLSVGDGKFTLETLTDLGIIPGVYQFTFNDHLSNSITTSIDLDFVVPEQEAHVLFPRHRQTGVSTNSKIIWEKVSDPDVNSIVIFIENDEENWEQEHWGIEPDNTSYPLDDLPIQENFECQFILGHMKESVTEEHIPWIWAGYTSHNIDFSTGCAIGDYNCDSYVNFADFAIFSSAWLSTESDSHWNPACDIDLLSLGTVDFLDLNLFIEKWLTEYNYYEELLE